MKANEKSKLGGESPLEMAGLIHDLAGGMAVVFGSMEMARLAVLDADRLAWLERGGTASGRCRRLLDQMGALARGEAVAGPRHCQPATVIAQALEAVAATLPPHIRLVHNLWPNLRAVGLRDDELHRILLNLMNNARDAMPEGGRLIVMASNARVRDHDTCGQLGITPAAGDYVVVTVRDTGTGMSPAVQQRLFEPYRTTKEPGRGTGLGLFTVKHLLTKAGGAVTLRSVPSVGTRFTVFLPVHAE